MEEEILIKRVCGSDLPECLTVIHRSFRTVADEFGLTAENCPTNGAFIPSLRLQEDYRSGALMYTLYENGDRAGFVQLTKKGDAVFELEKLAVLPEYRHRGYGKRLVGFVRDEARKLGARKITIGIIEENTRLKDWYAMNGFVHAGTRRFPHLPFTVGFMELPCCLAL